ncbi:glycoside hydrolase family 31 protein [Fodinibius salsisoli]|uniref:Glycoside hydrolase family 31 protein n=1 Tax=Fodinibius salsisoli TaxID=2820877 RepID=A0ABT3PMS5_9BACT|nr:glycoside hydrolase family 31 protein [Fodinibius salsisoli]MCW9707018.1 glycoside hydrolase family 31 protein [Fodinibius salsisoli]
MAKKEPVESTVTEEADDGRQPDVISKHRPDQIENVDQKGPHITFTTANGIELHLTVHTPEIIQLKYYLEGDLRSDFSYAVDPEFTPPEPNFILEEQQETFIITTKALVCRVSKKNLLVHFYDTEGNALCQDKAGFYRRESIMKGIREIKITKQHSENIHYFGLGDKVCKDKLKGEAFENWNTDAFEYKRGDDPLYRSVPFYMALNDGQAYGIFLDNTYRSRFDFGKKKKKTTSFSVEGGIMNYYFIYGPELTTVSERYAQLTGTPDMPPMWALGYHQCRWSYYPESRVRELADTFRSKQIPCDALYLDIDYMDGYRCFTWNNDHFPDPKAMIEDLKEQGFETIVMIDPCIKADKDYFVYQQGKENDFFCKRPDGETILAPVWPSTSAFPDFTHPKVRDWWADLYEDHIAAKKVSGIWNDMNEPAVFEVDHKTFPDNIRHDYDGHACSHKKAHNIYGMQMARASYRGIKQHNAEKRPFLLTRANFAGGQRFAALWTGDNIASWDHLKLANEQCQRLSISGYSFVGTDIGGFVDDPTPELFTRWLQLGIFHPLFRNHTMGFNVDGSAAVDEQEIEQKKKRKPTSDQEPWAYGERYTDINRSVIELRYRLLHYLYTTFYDHINKGTPILRPLAYEDQSDARSIHQTDAFMFGPDILVSPVLAKGKKVVKTYFPNGLWYDYRTNEPYVGKHSYNIDAPITDIPFFVKAGTVLPLREVMQYTQERDPKTLDLNIYYGHQPSTSELYEDSEEGYDYAKGYYRYTKFNLYPDEEQDSLQLTADREGSYAPPYREVKINIIGLPFEPEEINVDGEAVLFSRTSEEKGAVYHFHTQPDFETIIIQ